MTWYVPKSGAKVGERVIKQQCDSCAGQGYHDDGTTCDDCEGKGVRVVLLVPCPVHRQAVACDPNGTLLGQCDGCAAEAARGIQILLSQQSTEPRRSFLAESAPGLRRRTV